MYDNVNVKLPRVGDLTIFFNQFHSFMTAESAKYENLSKVLSEGERLMEVNVRGGKQDVETRALLRFSETTTITDMNRYPFIALTTLSYIIGNRRSNVLDDLDLMVLGLDGSEPDLDNKTWGRSLPTLEATDGTLFISKNGVRGANCQAGVFGITQKAIADAFSTVKFDGDPIRYHAHIDALPLFFQLCIHCLLSTRISRLMVTESKVRRFESQRNRGFSPDFSQPFSFKKWYFPTYMKEYVSKDPIDFVSDAAWFGLPYPLTTGKGLASDDTVNIYKHLAFGGPYFEERLSTCPVSNLRDVTMDDQNTDVLLTYLDSILYFGDFRIQMDDDIDKFGSFARFVRKFFSASSGRQVISEPEIKIGRSGFSITNQYTLNSGDFNLFGDLDNPFYKS